MKMATLPHPDQELLALAAKASNAVSMPNGKYLVYKKSIGWIFEYVDGTRGSWWNPLTNDADAFRLAVDLDMDMYLDEDKKGTFWNTIAACKQSCTITGSKIYFTEDSAKALRLAITTAAANIGSIIQ
jgi:hypothetical protein